MPYPIAHSLCLVSCVCAFRWALTLSYIVSSQRVSTIRRRGISLHRAHFR